MAEPKTQACPQCAGQGVVVDHDAPNGLITCPTCSWPNWQLLNAAAEGDEADDDQAASDADELGELDDADERGGFTARQYARALEAQP